MITLDQFRAMIPTNPSPAFWYMEAVDMLKKYEITTPNRIAGFMAQCAHESRDFTVLEENLNYSAERLQQVFGKRYFPSAAKAREFHRNPEKIANHVYMDANRSTRGALGNVNPGDGWKFRGRGIKQLTGRNNYEAFGRSIGMTADQAVNYISTRQGALESACWFWKTNHLNQYADADDIVGMSKRVNGGTIGLSDRVARYSRAKEILGSTKYYPRLLRTGSRGEAVKQLQKVLGVEADGIFGSQTEQALKQWQQVNGLVVDGIAGTSTLQKMNLT